MDEYYGREAFARAYGFAILDKHELKGQKKTVMISRKPVTGIISDVIRRRIDKAIWVIVEFDKEVWDEMSNVNLSMLVCPIDYFVTLN